MFGTNHCNIDIVSISNGLLYDDEDDIPTSGIIDVMIHPDCRRVSAGLESPLPDIIDGSKDDPRIMMPCSHAITPDNLYQMCSVNIKDGKAELRCFICNNIWNFNEVSEKADMSADEKIFWGTKLSLNSLRQNTSLDVTECPKCGCYCERVSKNDKWVICSFCSQNSLDQAMFCWNCKETNFTDDHVCCNLQKVQEILDSCVKKTIDYSKIDNVPSVRVCPKCGNMIEHHSECKSMECPKCHCEFCFVCLKICINGDLSCNNYKSICEVAPVQKII